MSHYQLLAIGNALVDVLAQASDVVLRSAGVEKGKMTLVDRERADAVYGVLSHSTETSGGSAANTVSGFVALGGTGGYLGKVAEDALGDVFASDMAAQGIEFSTAPLAGGSATGRSVILVTPDGERSMSTYLGACRELGVADMEGALDLLAECDMIFVEGYLWDAEESRAAAGWAMELAHEMMQPVALTLSDPGCVDRWRPEFLKLAENGTAAFVFANEKEICSLFGVPDADSAAWRAMEFRDTTFVITRGARGCTVVSTDGSGIRTSSSYPPAPVSRLVDTTGAGDMFAAGYLRGCAAGLAEADCARLGSLAASAIIRKVGARADFDAAERSSIEAMVGPIPAVAAAEALLS